MDGKDLWQDAQLLTELADGEWCGWLTPDSLLILRPKAGSSGCLGNMVPLSLFRAFLVTHEAYRRDLTTGTEEPLTAFNRQHSGALRARVTLMDYGEGSNPRREVKHDPPDCAVSPDGHWLLWRHDLTGAWHLASLDVDEQMPFPPAKQNGSVAWFPDGRRWGATVSEYRGGYHTITAFVHHRVDDSTYERRVQTEGLEDGLVVGMTAARTLLVRHPDRSRRWADCTGGCCPPPITEETFSAVPLSAGSGHQVRARRFAVTLPMPGGTAAERGESGAGRHYSGISDVWDVRLSPDGHRLAWIIAYDTGRGHFSEHYSFWTSDTEGYRFREIGSTPGKSLVDPTGPTGERYFFPHNLAWSPDGSRLSFTYGDKVYAVSVPPE